MNRNDSQIVCSNRPASRRLHRRHVHSAVTQCVVSSGFYGSKGFASVISLPKEMVREAGMFELLAAELRIAELEKALVEANEMAFTDPLTGALNRRGFSKAYLRELARARRSGAQLSIAYIDLDDFKSLNDTLGHQAGDKALVHLVNCLQSSMRPSDVLCRLGGEEFILMLPDTSLNDAATAISRFLSEFSAQVIPGTNCVMTFSAGVVAQNLDETLEEVIRRADAATYRAKRSGKNRVITC